MVRSDINALILDYLTVAGYPRAAEKFSVEANLEPHQDSQSIEIRQQIQNAIHNGRIRGAIENINDLDPEVRVPTTPGYPMGAFPDQMITPYHAPL